MKIVLARYQRLSSQLKFINDEVFKIPELRPFILDPPWRLGVREFRTKVGNAVNLIAQEPEILGFAALQWCAVTVGYYVWVQALRLMRPGMENDPLFSRAFELWCFLLVGIVALPLGILSGAMGVSHFLRAQKRASTFVGCIRISTLYYFNLWIFSWIDGWITVKQILERLPKSKRDMTIAQIIAESKRKFASEILYYGWKVATFGMIPAILNGRTLVNAAKESLQLLRSRMSQVLFLRAGYSTLCWLVGIGSYIAVVLLVQTHIIPVQFSEHRNLELYLFYSYAGIPISLSAGTVLIFLRPIYVISSCEVYGEFIRVEKLPIVQPIAESTLIKVVFTLLFLLLALIGVAIWLLNSSEAVLP